VTDSWIAACRLDELPDMGCKEFAFEEDGTSVHGFFVCKNGMIRAYRNSCPHLKIGMNWLSNQFLDYRREHIQCALHGALFTLDTGECVMGPCFGRYLEPLPFATQGEHLLMPFSVRFESALRWSEEPSAQD